MGPVLLLVERTYNSGGEIQSLRKFCAPLETTMDYSSTCRTVVAYSRIATLNTCRVHYDEKVASKVDTTKSRNLTYNSFSDVHGRPQTQKYLKIPNFPRKKNR